MNRAGRIFGSGAFLLTALILGRYLYEPYRLPDYLDDVFWHSYSSPGGRDALVGDLDSWSRELGTGFRFSLSGKTLHITHSRLSAHVVESIRSRFNEDREFLSFILLPETVKKSDREKGFDTPSWKNASRSLSQLGIESLRFENGKKAWDIRL
jgi:hypothetical protein